MEGADWMSSSMWGCESVSTIDGPGSQARRIERERGVEAEDMGREYEISGEGEKLLADRGSGAAHAIGTDVGVISRGEGIWSWTGWTGQEFQRRRRWAGHGR